MATDFSTEFATLNKALSTLEQIDPNTLSPEAQEQRDDELDQLQDLLADLHLAALEQLNAAGQQAATNFKSATAKLGDDLDKLNDDLARIKAIGDSVSALAKILDTLLA
ncbi:MAG TPA: hypothetical protein VFB32_03705 [Rudaea sp.]|nr:hypothetical protein [Rudaea sp.]